MDDASLPLPCTDQMAQFVARGYLRFDAVVPADINEQAMVELPPQSGLVQVNSTLHNKYVLERIVDGAAHAAPEATT